MPTLKTHRLYYSFDEGQTVQEQAFARNASYVITRINVDPLGLQQTAVLQGYEEQYKEARLSVQQVLLKVDFEKTKRCTFPGDVQNSDYLETLVTDADGNDCIQGRRTHVFRKSKQSRCFTALLQPPKNLNFSLCECSEQDWECDHGYIRVLSRPLSGRELMGGRIKL